MLTLATLRRTTNLFPTQYEGTSADGRPVYIRCKHGELTVRAGRAGGSINDAIGADPAVRLHFADDDRSELDWIEIEPLTGIGLPRDPTGITIDTARAADVGEIAKLMQRVWRESKPYLPQLNDDAAVRRFVENAINQATVRVASADCVIGFCVRSEGKVDHLYVDCSKRSRTVGSRLLGEALIGAASVRLVVLARNRDAHAFYRRRGFVEERQSESKTGETQIEMLWQPGLLP
jgi:ribosomal protein S18 acetylase RimI-like enzyme